MGSAKLIFQMKSQMAGHLIAAQIDIYVLDWTVPSFVPPSFC